ncbi:hypothetical protein [Neobacillus thermocopriae]|uniref:hypothetical protein n=1 Tax=Neobacillus thermocopriae TaxID=1215031 RepID=UPI0037700D6E
MANGLYSSKNRELVAKINKITNPLPNNKRKRKSRNWSMTIEEIYISGEEHAIKIKKWKEQVRMDLEK